MQNNQFKPFSNFATPFTIGLQLLGENNVFQPDQKFEKYLAEKQSLFESSPDEVFQAEADTLEAQNEVLDFVLTRISMGNNQGKSPKTIHCPISHNTYNRTDYSDRPLMLASLLVQDDLVIMRRKANNWHLVAASLCFPSSWNLAEKFGKPLVEIHRPVPGINDGLDPMINRIFNNLQPDTPVWRENWSFYGDDELRHDSVESNRQAKGEHAILENDTFIRREYQTLHKLPISGGILFTIKILIEPLDIIAHQRNPAKIATLLLGQIESMNKAQLQYKRLDKNLTYLRNYLRPLSET